MIESKKYLERVEIHMDNERQVVARICLSRAWNLVELLNSLYHMAVNDNIKSSIYTTMNKNIKTIVLNGNQYEVDNALELLWQLCFDGRVLEQVMSDEILLGRIKKFVSSGEESLKMCKRIAKVNIE